MQVPAGPDTDKVGWCSSPGLHVVVIIIISKVAQLITKSKEGFINHCMIWNFLGQYVRVTQSVALRLSLA